MTQNPQDNLKRNEQELKRLFRFFVIDKIELLHSGYKARNYKLTADGKEYFLKEYCQRVSHTVYQIKQSEQYFFDSGLPVLLPYKDVRGRSAFYINGNWFSLFPFVTDQSLSVSNISDQNFHDLGELTARIHLAGKDADHSLFQKVRLGKSEQFLWEYEDLMDAISQRSILKKVDERIIETLRQKKRLIESFKIKISDIPVSNVCLIHGDMIYQNVLTNSDGTISYLIDFEKTCVAPRAYELARSLMINCFDTGWDDSHFEHARIFLNSYRDVSPISYEEFFSGIRMYWMDVSHMTWLEAKYLFSDNQELEQVYLFHSNRISHIEEDPTVFCQRIYDGR